MTRAVALLTCPEREAGQGEGVLGFSGGRWPPGPALHFSAVAPGGDGARVPRRRRRTVSAASRTPPWPGLPLASSPGLWEGVTTARSAGWCPAQPGPSPQLRPCTQSPGFRLPRGCFYKPRLCLANPGRGRSWLGDSPQSALRPASRPAPRMAADASQPRAPRWLPLSVGVAPRSPEASRAC